MENLNDYKIIKKREEYEVISNGVENPEEIKRMREDEKKLQMMGVKHYTYSDDNKSSFTVSGYYYPIRNYSEKIDVLEWEYLEHI